MLATAERVVATVPTGGVGGGEGADKNEAIPLRTTDNYLQAMRSLQFGTSSVCLQSCLLVYYSGTSK